MRTTMSVMVASLFAVAWLGCSGEDTRPYNVVLATFDTTRADHLGCYGRAEARTPHIDRVAAEGARFTRCSACSPLTTPSHASILTGNYPFVHGVRHNGNRRLPDSQTTLAEALQAQGYRTHAAVAAFVVNRGFGLDQGFDTYQDVEARDGNVYQAERKGDSVADDAVAAVAEMADDPFFLWVHFYDPHDSYQYDAQIAFMDVQMGRIVTALEEHDIADRTLIVFVADHGEGLGEHDEDFHGDFLYESTINVPLVVHAPGLVPAGTVVDAQVRTIDVPATVLDLLGLPPLPDTQGVSLAPLLRGEGAALDLTAYAETLKGQLQFGLSPLRSLSTDRWKYVHAPTPELYDLAADGGEARNVIDAHPDVAQRMRERMRTLLASSERAATEEVALSSEERQRLESLGYVGLGGSAAGDESFAPIGPDPKDYQQAVRDYGEASVALKSGRYPQAEVLLRRVVDALPEAPAPHGDLAYAVQLQGRAGEAIPIYQRALTLDPGFIHIRRMFVGLYLGEAEWAKAMRQIALVLEVAPDDPEMHFAMALCLESLGDLDDAHAHLTTALEHAPDSARYAYSMGVLSSKRSNPDEAARWFERTLALEPAHAQARRALARLRSR